MGNDNQYKSRYIHWFFICRNDIRFIGMGNRARGDRQYPWGAMQRDGHEMTGWAIDEEKLNFEGIVFHSDLP